MKLISATWRSYPDFENELYYFAKIPDKILYINSKTVSLSNKELASPFPLE